MRGPPLLLDYGNLIPSDLAALDLRGIKRTADLNIPRSDDFGCAQTHPVWPCSCERKRLGKAGVGVDVAPGDPKAWSLPYHATKRLSTRE
jgi:hypothetical protein